MMTWETARRALDLASAAPFVLQFSGGEPLLALPLLQRIADYIEKKGISARMALQTNGTLLTEEGADFLSRVRIGIGVSVDGRPAVHDMLRPYADGRGSSADVVRGIALLAERGIEIGLTCVVTADNVATLGGIVEMAYYFGNVRRIGFDLLRAQGRGATVHAAGADDVTQAMEEVFACCRRFEMVTGRHISIAQAAQAVCRAEGAGGEAGFSHCHAMHGAGVHVDAGGMIYACSSFVGDTRYVLGDVHSGVDVRRQEAVADEMRRAMMVCRRCRDFICCGGACYARHAGGEEMAGAECALKRAAIRATGV